MLENLRKSKELLIKTHPLIHSITSPIAINDCANAVLSLGAQPICAEHPFEVAAITATAKALTVSLANITQARLESIHIAGKTAHECKIPSLIDLVGITCSPMRMEAAKRFIEECRPAVVKGNYTEIKAIAGDEIDKESGIDVSEKDLIYDTEDIKLRKMLKLVHDYAARTETVVMASGAIDLVSDGKTDICIKNGHTKMSRVTGTGCILTCITGTYLAVASPLEASLYAILNWDISGEIAAEYTEKNKLGLASFHIALMDQLSLLNADDIIEEARIEINRLNQIP